MSKTITIDEALHMAALSQQEGDVQKAANIYDTILKSHPDQLNALNALAILYAGNANYDEALSLMSKAANLAPDNVAIRHNLANILSSLNKNDEAIAHYKSIIQSGDGFADVHYNLGNVYRSQGEFDVAIEEYRKALAMNNSHMQAYNNLGASQMKINYLDDAENTFTEAIKQDPQHAESFNNLGVIAGKRGELLKAIEYYKQAIAISSDYVDPYNNMGVALNDLQRPQDAIRAHEKAIALKPDHAAAYTCLGAVLIKLDRYEEALPYFEKALSVDPQSVDAICGVGNVEQHEGHFDKAEDCYIRAINLEPDNVFPHFAQANILSKQGRSKEALEKYYSAYEVLFKKPKELARNLPHAGQKDTTLTEQALLDVQELFCKHDLKFFLCFGALLGFMREGGLLPFDKDVDIGVASDVAPQRVIDAFVSSEEWSVPKEYCVKKSPLLVTAYHCNGMVVDIFFHRDKDTKIYTGIDAQHDALLWEFSRFDLVEKDFIGRKFLIPKDYDRYLTEIYGDWQTPDPYFDSAVSGENISEQSRDMSLCYGFDRLYEAIRSTNYTKALKYCDQIEARFTDEKIIGKVRAYLLAE